VESENNSTARHRSHAGSAHRFREGCSRRLFTKLIIAPFEKVVRGSYPVIIAVSDIGIDISFNIGWSRRRSTVRANKGTNADHG